MRERKAERPEVVEGIAELSSSMDKTVTRVTFVAGPTSKTAVEVDNPAPKHLSALFTTPYDRPRFPFKDFNRHCFILKQ